MASEEFLPVLYDFAVTIGNETSLEPLLTRTLQRLLFHTSFPAGFICLDIPSRNAHDGEMPVQIDAAAGDYDLIGLVRRQFSLPNALLCGSAACEADKPELLASLAGVRMRYKSFFRLPIDDRNVIVLLAPKIPVGAASMAKMLTPVMGLLAKAIVLCRNNDEFNQGLIAERNLLSGVFESSSSGVMLTDAEVNIIEVNQAFTRITGYSKEEIRGKNPQWLSSGRQDYGFYLDMWRDINEKGHWQGEIWNRRKNGDVYPEWLSINPVFDKAGVLANYIGIFSDISERKEAEAQIHQLAFYDPLTNLPNRRLLMDRLKQAFTASARSREHGAVLFLDLDNFKTLNDTKGHDVGDLLLSEVAKRLNMCVREGDTVARLGGDEFVVVLKSLSTDVGEAATQAELVGEKIRSSLNQPYQLNDHLHHTTPSIGVALFSGHKETPDTLLKHADTAMYQAKVAGRNALRFYDPAMQATLEARIELENELRQAIKRQELKLYYQIQVDHLFRPLGAEVLLRWEHPVHGLVAPMKFVSLAEETGLIVPIGTWVLQAACKQLRLWKNDGLTRNLTLSVNVSTKQFRQADFVAQVQGALKDSGIRPSQLMLELTESTVLGNFEDTITKMRELKKLGISFSIDDFGTGFSSLQYLKRLPLDQIKIDQSFVHDIANDPNDAAIVKTIIAMTQAMGLNVIAEGVETEAQREFLGRNGCLVFQGYLFSVPVTVNQFVGKLRAGKQLDAHSSALP